ncbi:hypothetical protein KHA80_00300 [Anaerobacillus sp. HL2]|nr:hypothetical protein KHA80_00300 [Anaerobacillus sp. HL2]
MIKIMLTLKISVNERLGHGNTLDNSREVYEDATVIEYYFSGFDPQYDGMDWRSYVFALEKGEDGNWYLSELFTMNGQFKNIFKMNRTIFNFEEL